MAALGDPAALEALATTYEQRSEEVCTSGRRLRQAAETTGWQCLAADRFRCQVHGTEARADRVADEMRTVARRLRDLAEEIRQELARLAAIEQRALATCQAWSGEGQPPWHGSPWHPGNLPASGDPSWYAVQRAWGV